MDELTWQVNMCHCDNYRKHVIPCPVLIASDPLMENISLPDKVQPEKEHTSREQWLTHQVELIVRILHKHCHVYWENLRIFDIKAVKQVLNDPDNNIELVGTNNKNKYFLYCRRTVKQLPADQRLRLQGLMQDASLFSKMTKKENQLIPADQRFEPSTLRRQRRKKVLVKNREEFRFLFPGMSQSTEEDNPLLRKPTGKPYWLSLLPTETKLSMAEEEHIHTIEMQLHRGQTCYFGPKHQRVYLKDSEQALEEVCNTYMQGQCLFTTCTLQHPPCLKCTTFNCLHMVYYKGLCPLCLMKEYADPVLQKDLFTQVQHILQDYTVYVPEDNTDLRHTIALCE